jgi:hypothetical protein
MLSTHLIDVEPKEVDKSDAASERFRYTFRQMRGCRTKDKESGGVFGPIHQYSKQFKQVRAALNFVDNYQTGKVFQYPQRCRQSAKVNRVFQIEINAGFSLRHDPGESGLATLSWTQEGGDRMDSEDVRDAV